ncbi:MAG: 4Fe-4S binding protein [Lentisphaeria bacterium]|nr:4Fe-4S binding protein [Lentisphaeria bacterium]MBQ7206732.1 4Fe-4S binding protein [Lentisphaeria bacterium]
MNTLKEKIISRFVKFGGDLVRFGSVEQCTDPTVHLLMPEARTVICAAFRQLRGARRGIEEGSTYYQYTTNAVEVLEENVMPIALLRVCALLEDEGFEALPQRRNQTVMSAADDTNFEVDHREIYRNRQAEHQLDFEQCALDCGLGERGLSGSILTKEFGPFQRYVFILTDAEIEPDQPFSHHLCDHCGECVQACPGHALSAEGRRDRWQCSAYYIGANMTKNPFMPPEAFGDDPERLAIISGEVNLSPERARAIIEKLIYYPPIKHGYWSSICGRACDTACYIHLEEKGILTKKFNSPFRIRPEWHLPLLTTSSNPGETQSQRQKN